MLVSDNWVAQLICRGFGGFEKQLVTFRVRSYHPVMGLLQLGTCSILSGRSAAPTLLWW